MINYYTNLRSELLDASVQPFGRCLDVGCGEGTTGGFLLEQNQATEVFGIEVVPDVAYRAKARLTDVVVADLNSDDLAGALGGLGSFDTILFGDVLEHLVEPLEILRFFTRHLLKKDGQALVSLPNVQSLEVVAPLVLRGQFDYRDSGILDRTHLRFFTRKSAERLLDDAGLQIVSRGRIHPPAKSLLRLGMRIAGPFSVRQYVYGCQPKRRQA